MAIDPLQVWKKTLDDLPESDSIIWATRFASWYSDRIQNIQPDPASLTGPFSFTFNKPAMIAALMLLGPTMSSIDGIKKFADAWNAAIASTIVVVSAGAAIPPPSPPTTFSVVISTVIDPPSIALGYAKILELAAAPFVKSTFDSQFPVKFREATLLLTITVTGLDSTPTPAGPLPLVAPLVPLI